MVSVCVRCCRCCRRCCCLESGDLQRVARAVQDSVVRNTANVRLTTDDVIVVVVVVVVAGASYRKRQAHAGRQIQSDPCRHCCCLFRMFPLGRPETESV